MKVLLPTRISRSWHAVAALALLGLACAPQPEIRHVVLMSLDAVGAKHVSAYGYERETTPHLDAVAREGVLAESAYTQQAWTLTSHLTMMTGLHPEVHGASKRHSASPAAITLAEVLWTHGFATAAFTGTRGWMHPRFGLGRGFDTYEMGQGDARSDTPRIVEWLGEQARRLEANPAHRFFLFVHYYDAHSDVGTPVPYALPSPYADKYLPEGRSWRRTGGTALLLNLAKEGATDLDREFVTAYYDASVSYVDEQGVAPVVAALRELGLEKGTLLVVTADHGEEIFEHGSVLHRQPYDETARVPLVFRGPGLIRGKRVSHLVALADLMPTILSLLALPTPSRVQGRDLTPLLRGDGPVNDAVYLDGGHGDDAYPSSVVADLDDRRWSYVTRVGSREDPEGRVFFARMPGELYALDDDPQQHSDLAAQHPQLARRLEEKLLAWFRANHALARRLGRGPEIERPSPEERRQLEALGYAK